MKIFIIGLNGLSAESLLGDERLENLRRLMEIGCYGRLRLPEYQTADNLWSIFGAGSDQRGETHPTRLPVPIWDLVALMGKSSLVISDHSPLAAPKAASWVSPQSARAVLTAQETGSLQQPELRDRIQQYLASHDARAREAHILGYEPFDLTETLLQSLELDFLLTILEVAELVKFHPLESIESRSSFPSVESVSKYLGWVDSKIGQLFEHLTDETILLITALDPSESAEAAFILAAANNPRFGQVDQASWVDLAPTLLDLAGHWIPDSMQGRSLVLGMEKILPETPGMKARDIEVLRERLSGLGYIE